MRPQASSMRAEVAGHCASSSMASYTDARMRAKASWVFMMIAASSLAAAR